MWLLLLLPVVNSACITTWHDGRSDRMWLLLLLQNAIWYTSETLHYLHPLRRRRVCRSPRLNGKSTSANRVLSLDGLGLIQIFFVSCLHAAFVT